MLEHRELRSYEAAASVQLVLTAALVVGDLTGSAI